MSSKTSDAIYISSLSGNVFHFDYGHNYKNVNSKEEFISFVEEFNEYVLELGKKHPFSEKIIAAMDEDEIDMILVDAQIRPKSTFFICTPSGDRFVDVVGNNEFKMIGNNGFKTLFYSKDAGVYDVVDTKKASQIYVRIK